MIVIKSVEIKLTKINIQNYIDHGYNCIVGESIVVLNTHLMRGSHCLVDVECDVCNKVNNIEFRRYFKMVKEHGYFSCKGKCSTQKIEKTKLRIYGVTNNSKLQSWKDGIEYLWENRTESEIKEISTKIQNTNIINHGYKNYLQSEVGQEKFKKICMEKYGVTNPSYIEESKEKRKKTKLEKFGHENNSQSEEWRESSRQTRIKNGHQVPDELKSPFELYRDKVGNLTRKVKNSLFENWDDRFL